jgi:PAS domain S-box-containing protein
MSRKMGRWSSKDGAPTKKGGIIQDITERKRTEDALRESEQRYQALIETNVDLIWEEDRKAGTPLQPPDEEALGPEDMLGRTSFDSMPPMTREEKLEQSIEQAAQPAGFRGLSSVARDASGKVIYLKPNGVPFFGDDGTLLGYMGINRDVTEKVGKRVQEGEPRGK